MSCETYQESISAFLDGGLDEGRTTELFLHAGVCDSCREFFRSTVAIQRGFRELPAPAVPPTLDRRVLSIPAGVRTPSRGMMEILRSVIPTRFTVPAPAFVTLVTCSLLFLALSLGLFAGLIPSLRQPDREVIPIMTVPTVEVYGVSSPANNTTQPAMRNR